MAQATPRPAVRAPLGARQRTLSKASGPPAFAKNYSFRRGRIFSTFRLVHENAFYSPSAIYRLHARRPSHALAAESAWKPTVRRSAAHPGSRLAPSRPPRRLVNAQSSVSLSRTSASPSGSSPQSTSSGGALSPLLATCSELPVRSHVSCAEARGKTARSMAARRR